ncbi:MAG: hypothetical protein V3V14_06625 [Saprospiraceae bacterium]
MKKAGFIIFTLISIVSYVYSGLLLGMHFSDNDPGMVLILLVPLLIGGLVSGLAAYLIKKLLKLELNQFSKWLHFISLALMVFGSIALIYTINS